MARRNYKRRNPDTEEGLDIGGLTTKLALATIAPATAAGLTALDVADAVDQGLLDETMQVMLAPMQAMGEGVVSLVENPCRRNPDPNQVFEPAGGDYVLHRSWGSWYPMVKTRGGNLAFLNKPSDNHDGSKGSAQRIIAQHKRGGGKRRNPDSDAASLYEQFHGRPSQETVEVVEEIHEHDHLAALGELQSLKLVTPYGDSVEIEFTEDHPFLSSNEKGTQLFVTGGDQQLDLSSLGFSKQDLSPEAILLGVCTEFTYQTEKGFDNFKLIDYYHKPGEESGVQPCLVYDRINCKLSFVGGQYRIKPEGVVN